MYEIAKRGEKGTLDYRVYITKHNIIISPVHEIELYPILSDMFVNMVVEIPKGTCLKMEIKMNEINNPLGYDVKDGNVRKSEMLYPYNYGALPKTWENPLKKMCEPDFLVMVIPSIVLIFLI